MLGMYKQGESAILYTNFHSVFSEPYTITNARITIKHIDGTGTEIIDIDNVDLTNITGNEYYYRWVISSGAFLGDYLVIFSATIDDDYGEGTENIKVVSSNEVLFAGAHYTTADIVADFLGGSVEAVDITEAMLAFGDGYVDTNVGFSFRTGSATEKYDGEVRNQGSIYVKNYPIIAISEVKDGDDIIDPDDYVIYNDEGIIKLKEGAAFDIGLQNISITYDYGFSGSIPSEVVFLATILVAEIIENKLVNEEGGILKLEKIGDYTYEYFKESMGSVFAQRNKTIKRLIDGIKAEYGQNPNTWSI